MGRKSKDKGYERVRLRQERNRKNHEHNKGVLDLDSERMKRTTDALLSKLESVAGISEEEEAKARKEGYDNGFEEGYAEGKKDGFAGLQEKVAAARAEGRKEGEEVAIDGYAQQAKAAYERGRKDGVAEAIDAIRATCRPLMKLFENHESNARKIG